jgi:hypothetical protein
MQNCTEYPTNNLSKIEVTFAPDGVRGIESTTAVHLEPPGEETGTHWAGIHLCSAEAAAAAPVILPPAECVAGGDGEPPIHWWRVQAPVGAGVGAFTDPDAQTPLLEVLASLNSPVCCQGKSTPASGERATEVAPDLLTAAFLDLAAVSLLARHLPQSSNLQAELHKLAGWLLLLRHRQDHVARLVDALAAALGMTPEAGLGAAIVKQAQAEPPDGAQEFGARVPPQVLGWLGDADRFWAGQASANRFRVADDATPAEVARQIDAAVREWGDDLPRGLGEAELSIYTSKLEPVIKYAMTVLTPDAVTAILEGLVRRLREAGYKWINPKKMRAWCAAIAGNGSSAPAAEEEISEEEWLRRANTPPANDGRETQGGANPREPTAVVLVRLALDAGVELLHQADQRTYASVRRDGRRETWPIRSRKFRAWLAGLYRGTRGHGPGNNALSDAVSDLDDLALESGTPVETHLRVAGHGDKIYLDLGDPTWRAVEIDAEGWRIVDSPPVVFRRPKGMLALPEPVRGGSLDELRPSINVADDDNWLLLIGWLAKALRPRGPYPVLALAGEPGAAKTSVGRFLQQLIDPSVTKLRSAPREDRDLAIAAQNCWLVAYDNLSSIPAWLADALCRLATGAGFGTRQLYSDDEEALFVATRPALLTSITDITRAPDLGQRSILLHLGKIDDTRRRTEEELDAQFALVRPRILGALLDAVSNGLRLLPGLKVERLPRMADFAIYAEAVCQGLGYPPGAFINAFDRNRLTTDSVALEASPIAEAIMLMVETQDFYGTATDLLARLRIEADKDTKQQREWPAKPNHLSGQLRYIADSLRRTGITVDLGDGRGHKQAKMITLSLPPEERQRRRRERQQREAEERAARRRLEEQAQAARLQAYAEKFRREQEQQQRPPAGTP